MKPIFASLLGLGLASAALAEGITPDRLYVPLASYHHNIDPPAASGMNSWNEFNPGLILTWEDRFATLDYSAGLFLNSYDDVSPMVSVGKLWDVGQVSLGATVMFADYGDNARFFDNTVAGSDIVFLPAFQVNYRNVFAQVIPAPQSNGDTGAVFTAGMTFALGQ